MLPLKLAVVLPVPELTVNLAVVLPVDTQMASDDCQRRLRVASDGLPFKSVLVPDNVSSGSSMPALNVMLTGASESMGLRLSLQPGRSITSSNSAAGKVCLFTTEFIAIFMQPQYIVAKLRNSIMVFIYPHKNQRRDPAHYRISGNIVSSITGISV